jgi:NADH-quinone oxidoreductase subunit C
MMADDEQVPDEADEAREGAHEDGPETVHAAGPQSEHGVLAATSLGQSVLHPSREQLHELVATLAGEGYHVCIDVTAVDHLANPNRTLPAGVTPERFEVVVGLLDHEHHRRVRLIVQVPVGDPVVPSITDLHPGADALEREVFDMFGITFDGHPDLTRILMPEDWEGHPLRKDYGVGAIPVQFKGAGRERA